MASIMSRCDTVRRVSEVNPCPPSSPVRFHSRILVTIVKSDGLTRFRPIPRTHFWIRSFAHRRAKKGDIS